MTPRRWLIVEDGQEYRTRFARFGGEGLELGAANSLAAVEALLAESSFDGLLFDLDFRRTPATALIDDQGASAAALPAAEQQRLAKQQGIYILLALRQRGITIPAILCADLDDEEQCAYLKRTLAPLEICGSTTALRELLDLMLGPERIS